MGKEPTGSEVLKYRLWQQQRGECAYTQKQILLDNLFSPGYCEIDHIIPFSRCFDDSLSNKVLVMGLKIKEKAIELHMNTLVLILRSGISMKYGLKEVI